MARPNTKTSSATVAATEKVAVADLAVEVARENVKEVVEEKLTDRDEIAVKSLVPNVTYEDSKTGDIYKWEEVGDTEYLTVETLKNMMRMHKGYFRNLILRPLDDRVIKMLGISKVYADYENLMDPKNYTRKNLPNVLEEISKAPDSIKSSVINRIFGMVENGEIADVQVMRDIEKRFNIDLISLL